MVSQIDVFPTLCALLDIDPPPWLQGRSLLPTLEGRPIREETFAEITYHAAYQPQRAVRTDRWLYIQDFTGRERPTLTNVDDSASKALWVDAGWSDHPTPAVRLHDLVFDPHEQHNLAARQTLAITRAELAGRLESWMSDTDDPLLLGPVPAPAGFPPPRSPDALPSKA